MKHSYITLYRWAAASLAAIALAACTAADPTTDPQPPANNDPLAALSPQTPVALAATLGAYGQGHAAKRTRATDPASLTAILAEGEITTAAAINAKGESTAGKANVQLILPGSSDPDNSLVSLYGSTVGQIGNCDAYSYNSGSKLDGDGRLKLRHFNLSATNAAGQPQAHSRVGILYVSSYSRDQLYAIARLGTDANGAPTGKADFAFDLQHTRAKVSVLLKNVAGNPIDATTTLKGASIKMRLSDADYIYTGGGANAEGKYPLLNQYLKAADTDGNYPDDPSSLTENTKLAIYHSSSSPVEFPLKHPAGEVPDNFINGIVHASVTHTDDYIPLTPDGAPCTYAAAEVISITLHVASLNKEVTYSLPLSSIALTGLPQDDPRNDGTGTGNGHLNFLRPGEHLCLNITADDALQTITANATITPWSTAEANEDLTGDEAKYAPFNDLNFCTALKDYHGFVLNAEGRVDVTNDENIAKFASTTSLNLMSYDIANLDGIECFTALKTLLCFDNQLTALDISENTALTNLICGDNQLTALDISKNTELTWLDCYDNQLTTLDVSKNTKLTELYCHENQLTALDISKNTALTTLDCSYNQLTTLDVLKNTKLEYLYCYENRLAALDVSKNTALTNLYCYGNRLATLDASVISDWNANIFCGKQTTDGTTAQTLALTLRSTLKGRWENELKGNQNNAGVNATFVDVTP